MAFKFVCTKRRESEKAVLAVDHESGEEVWVPLSQIESMHFDGRGEGHMMISDWIAREKNLV